jgi:hypothetical protein
MMRTRKEMMTMKSKALHSHVERRASIWFDLYTSMNLV